MNDKDKKPDSPPDEPETEDAEGASQVCILGRLDSFPGGPEAYAQLVKMEHDAIIAARAKRKRKLH